MKGRRPHIFWRIFTNSLLIILIVAAAVVVTMLAMQPELRFNGRPLLLHQVAAGELGRHLGDPPELQATLERLCRTMGSSAAVYTAQGKQLASTGESPPGPLSLKDGASQEDYNGTHFFKGSWVRAVKIPDGQAYLLINAPRKNGLLFFVVLASVLAALALTSWFMARRFAKPIERLTATSRALAGGDLTARSELRRNDEVGELSKAMDEMAARLEQNLRREQQILADISHEIRTPLARLRVALELLEEDPGDSQAVLQRIQGINSDLSELELMVDNVLTNARLDLAAGKTSTFAPHIRPVELNEFFDDLAARFRRYYPGQSLLTDFASCLPPAELDASLLKRACDNLLDNAAKYNTPGQPVTLRVRAAAGQHFTVEVSDCGKGASPEELERLFDPFYRSIRDSRAKNGSGLGLTITRRVVEYMGGSIEARLNQGPGMTFSITMPLRQKRREGNHELHTS